LDDKVNVIIGGMVIIALFVVAGLFLKVDLILITVVAAMLVLVLTSAINLCANGAKWSETPFGLPKGTIRASITLIFIIIVVLGAFKIDNMEIVALPEWLLAILGTIIGFYFGERKGADAASDEDEAAELAKKFQSDVSTIIGSTKADDVKITEIKALKEKK
jgi:hypothetical protein